MRTFAVPARCERGAVMVIFVMAAIVVLLITGLAVDLGIAHVTLAKLSKAVDAGALAGARRAAANKGNVQAIVQSVAAANFGTGKTAASYGVEVTNPFADSYQVSVTGSAKAPTLFARLMNKKSVDVVTVADAIRYPLDLTLILDLSASLDRANGFDDLQAASKNFIEAFDDTIDQVGIVTYSTWASELMTLRKNFKASGKALIDAQTASSDTDIEEGLRIGKSQLDTAPKREKAIKVAVLFTDGRPTAFADNLRFDDTNSDCPADGYPTQVKTDNDGNGIPDCYSGVLATTISGATYRGVFTRDTGMKVIGFKKLTPLLDSNTSGSASPKPLQLPGGGAVNGDNIRAMGIAQSEGWATEMRKAGYTVYTIGLGDPSGAAGDVPDLDFLKRLANDDAVVSAAQPVGEMAFAPSAAELDREFAGLANRILARLTR